MKSTVLMMLFAAVSASSSVKCFTNEAGNVLCHHDGSGKSHDAKAEVNLITMSHHDGSGKSHDAKPENVLNHHDGSGKSHDNKPENVLNHHDGSGKSHDAKAEVNLKGSGGGGSGGSDGHGHNKGEINLKGSGGGGNDGHGHNQPQINLKGSGGGSGGNDGHGHLIDEDLLTLAEGEGDSVSATLKMDTYTITLISIFVAQIFFCFGICCWTKAQVSNAKKETVKQ